MAHSPGHCLRFALAPGLEDGWLSPMPAAAPARNHALGAAWLLRSPGRHPPRCLSYTLQALDATLAGASLREVAEGLFGGDAAADWYSDGGLRSKVRRYGAAMR